MIQLLLYSSDGEQRQRMLAAIHMYASEFMLETFADIRTLNRRLRRDRSGDIWLLLMAADPIELGRLSAMGELIKNTRSILILPDERRETVFVGHSLFPRFITYLDSDLSDVGSVLGMVIRKQNGQSQQT